MRRFPERPIVGVGAVVVDGDNVLLVKRGREPHQGEWTLPGGGVEVGETLQAAVIRELQEETGLTVEVGPVIEVLERMQQTADGRTEYHYVIIDYVCVVRGGVLAAGSDVDDARWVERRELPSYNLTGKATEVINKGFDIVRTVRL